MLLLFLEGEKTSQQRQQQVQKRKRGSGVCVCVCVERKELRPGDWVGVFCLLLLCQPDMFCNGAQRERKRGGRGGGAESEGHNRNDKRLLWSSVVAQTMFARKRQEASNKTNRTKTSMGLVGR
jgi:hypothetical protein